MDTFGEKVERSSIALDQLLLQSNALMAVGSGIMITDRQARILWANPVFTKSTGYPTEELLGRTPAIFKSGKHDPSFYSEFWEIVLSGKTWRGQFFNRRRDGRVCIHAQSTTPVRRHRTGPITHFISVNEDVTDGKTHEEHSREALNMETAGQLTAGIAHHFNNLLTVIQCNSEMMLEGKGGPDGGLAAPSLASELTRQLVSFSRTQVPELQVLDLNRVVEEAVHVFRYHAPGNIEWEHRYLPGLSSVLADGGRLGQVIDHLVVNAIDAMPQGGRLSLTTEKRIMTHSETRNRRAARPGEFVCLTVRDQGCGIPLANLPRIFEPFFTTKDTADRSGLGLALVHGIVKQAQGWIEVSSQRGRGTTFTIFLPAITEPVTVAPGARPSNQNQPLLLSNTNIGEP